MQIFTVPAVSHLDMTAGTLHVLQLVGWWRSQIALMCRVSERHYEVYSCNCGSVCIEFPLINIKFALFKAVGFGASESMRQGTEVVQQHSGAT